MSLMFASLIGTSDASVPVVKDVPKTVFRLLDTGYYNEYFIRPLTVIAPADSPDNIIDWGNGTTSTYGAGRTTPDVRLLGSVYEEECWEDCWWEEVGEDCWNECYDDCWWDEELDEEVCEEYCEEYCEPIEEEVCEEYCGEGETLIPTYEYTVTIYGNHTGVYINTECGSIELLELSPNLKQFRYGIADGSLKFPKGFHLPATVSDWSCAFEGIYIYGETDIETLLAEWTDNDPVERNVEMMFSTGNGLTGRAPAEKLWLSNNTWSSTYDCFGGNYDLENYDEIPKNWGGSAPPPPVYFVAVAAAGIDYNEDSNGVACKYARAWLNADGTFEYDTDPENFVEQYLRYSDFYMDCEYAMAEDRDWGKVYMVDLSRWCDEWGCDEYYEEPPLTELVWELCFITEVGEIPKDQLPTNVPGTDPDYVAIVSETDEEEFGETGKHQVDTRRAYQDASGNWRIDQSSEVTSYEFDTFCSRGDIMKCNWAGGSMGVVGRLAEGEL